VLSQMVQNGYVEDSLFAQLQVNMDPNKFVAQELAQEVKNPVKFSTFMLSETLFKSLEDQIAQMCQDGGYLNLAEILPDCFKSSEHTRELLEKVEQECRLMADENYVCSVTFLNKCVARFAKRSEQAAIAAVKQGARPDKLLNQQAQDQNKER